MDLIQLVGVVSFLLVVAHKWELLDIYDATRKTWMPSGGCYFCLGFWLSVIVQAITFSPVWLALPAAPFVSLIVSITTDYARRKTDG